MMKLEGLEKVAPKVRNNFLLKLKEKAENRRDKKGKPAKGDHN